MEMISRIMSIILCGTILQSGCNQAEDAPVDITPPEPEKVMEFNFDSDYNEEHVQKLLQINLIETESNSGINGSAAIKVAYVGYERGSMRVVKSFRLPQGYPEATLNYAVKFNEDFNFVKTGKLHGFGPVNHITGGEAIEPDGWSARVNFHEEGKIKTYVYHQNQPGKYGDVKMATDFKFVGGKYHRLALYVKVNDPPSAKNGIVEIYADGVLVIKVDNLQLRAVGGESSLVNNFLFSTFHGGSSPDFAPKDENGNYTTEYAWFDDIQIFSGKKVLPAY